jgi:Family of unknown function (DUF6221)
MEATPVASERFREFLKARLDEDEAAAKHASPAPWGGGRLYIQDAAGTFIAQAQFFEDGRHIARHDPARALREVAAWRRIIELADDATDLDDQRDSEFRVGPRDTTAEPYIGDLIKRAVAACWSDHPDYRETWRP